MWQPTRKGNGHKLPAQLTHFIGRTNELIEIARLLADPNCRLLTLCGPGGIGKTRLAIEAATHNASLFPGGIWMANLEPLSSIDEMISAIVATFGLQIQDGRNLQQQLLNYLSEHNCLLVMDNFEHLLDGAQLVTDMLAAAPNMKILATSRETLKLREEWVRHIQGLDVPDNEQVSDLQSYSAVQLFLEGAHRVRGDFSLDTQISCVVRLCQLVEGLPLAI